jgi:hypothetical protein
MRDTSKASQPREQNHQSCGAVETMAAIGAYHYVRNAQRSLKTQEVARTATIHRPEDSLLEGRALKINSVSPPFDMPTLRRPEELVNGILHQLE